MKTMEVVLARPIVDVPVTSDFQVRERDVPDRLDDGQLLVRVLYLSLDPYIGSVLRGRHMGARAPAPGEPLPGECVAEVLRSSAPDFRPGDLVTGEVGWVEIGVLDAGKARLVDRAAGVAAHLGVLGMPGLTAWAGVTQLARVGAGDVFAVDAAAGAVGGTAGQIARLLGARVIGIAGGPAKCALVRDVYGFDDCVDYRAPDWADRFAQATGDGPTAYLENVGTAVLDQVLARVRVGARIVLCGMVDHYHGGPPAVLPVVPLITRRLHVHGLVVYDFLARRQEWLDIAIPWMREGRLRPVEDVADGLANAPAHFERLMRGHNQGKALVRVDAGA
ncbi:NADP-dependent oxidoreductase [Azospirillum sp. B4]|uniref:MDR family NADP-dependent oxidoreductase n=1 Tax=Azospirillum sp. B4 TaxID=95605 RepID=UPI000347CE5A|nr:NADP-dependent oxidoreductase [Azospirillum sp. B4]